MLDIAIVEDEAGLYQQIQSSLKKRDEFVCSYAVGKALLLSSEQGNVVGLELLGNVVHELLTGFHEDFQLGNLLPKASEFRQPRR